MLRRAGRGAQVVLRDLELLKAIDGVDGPTSQMILPVLPNDQNIERLAEKADAVLDVSGHTVAYLIEGHGIYVWERDVKTAWRHLEAIHQLLVVAGDAMNEPVNAAAPKKEPSCKGNNATVDGASTTILLSPIAGGG